MKKCFGCLSGLFLFLGNMFIHAQPGATIYTSGSNIFGPCGDTLRLKGVNYAPYNWGWSPSQNNIFQVALTGANCIRLPWYKTTPDGPTPQATYNNLVNLDSALSKCIQKKLIPILELHDQTCQNSPSALITLANWYVQPAVITLINKYKHSLILNIANEALFVSWTSNTLTAQTNFVNTYTTIVNTLRGNNITVPIMIDGPDCGTNLDVLSNVGGTIKGSDPAQNIIFSAHAYWYLYANNDSLQMLSKINYALSKNIPFILGEIANLQDDVSMCQYTLNYKSLLKICKQKKVGWIAWSWDNDGCSARRMSSTGSFTALTTYGNDIVNNPVYGLATNSPAKSKYLLYGTCVSTGISEWDNINHGLIFPNPSEGVFNVNMQNDEVSIVNVYDINGKKMETDEIAYRKYKIITEKKGVYIVELILESGKILHFKNLKE